MKEQFKARVNDLVVDRGIRTVDLTFFVKKNNKWQETLVEEYTDVWQSLFKCERYLQLYIELRDDLKNKYVRKGKVFKCEC